MALNLNMSGSSFTPAADQQLAEANQRYALSKQQTQANIDKALSLLGNTALEKYGAEKKAADEAAKNAPPAEKPEIKADELNFVDKARDFLGFGYGKDRRDAIRKNMAKPYRSEGFELPELDMKRDYIG